METRGPDHIAELLSALVSDGYTHKEFFDCGSRPWNYGLEGLTCYLCPRSHRPRNNEAGRKAGVLLPLHRRLSISD